MSEQKRYTAQEMREEADYCDSVATETECIRKIGLEDGEIAPECLYRKLCGMLRQSAAMTERCETVMRDLHKKLPDEVACVVEGVMNYVMLGNSPTKEGASDGN